MVNLLVFFVLFDVETCGLSFFWVALICIKKNNELIIKYLEESKTLNNMQQKKFTDDEKWLSFFWIIFYCCMLYNALLSSTYDKLVEENWSSFRSLRRVRRNHKNNIVMQEIAKMTHNTLKKQPILALKRV